MRTVSAGLEAHIAGEATTLATLWKVTRRDAAVYGFTDHDADLTVGGVTYESSTGYSRSAARALLGAGPTNLDVQGLLDSAALTREDLVAGLWDYAVVEMFLVNWANTAQGTLQLTKGKLGKVSVGRHRFSAELNGLSKHLDQTIGRVYTPACDDDLGGPRCQINLASFTVGGTVSSVTSRRVFGTALGQASGYFDGGMVTWLTGANAGLEMEVKTFGSGAFALQLPMPYTIQAGDTFNVSAGCDKTFATCVSKFANGINYQGFPSVPGTDALISGQG